MQLVRHYVSARREPLSQTVVVSPLGKMLLRTVIDAAEERVVESTHYAA
jgi:hypothetical protein